MSRDKITQNGIMNSSCLLAYKQNSLSLKIMLPVIQNPQRLAHFKSSISLTHNLTRSITMIRLKSSLPAVAVGAVAWIRVDWLHRVALSVLNVSILEQALVWKVFPWVVPGDNEDRKNDRNELKANKVVLVVGELAVNSLAGLRKTEDSTDGDEDGSDEEADEETAFASERGAELVFADKGDCEGGEEDEEDKESACLESETSQKNGVGLVGLLIVLVGLRNTDQCRAENLENRRDNISANEDPKDQLWAKPLAASES